MPLRTRNNTGILIGILLYFLSLCSHSSNTLTKEVSTTKADNWGETHINAVNITYR